MLLISPVIAEQSLGNVSLGALEYVVHAYHWFDSVGLGYPVQIPGSAMSELLPAALATAVPEIVGFSGASERSNTLVVVAEILVVEAVPALCAVIATAMRLPACTANGLNVSPVASVMAEQSAIDVWGAAISALH